MVNGNQMSGADDLTYLNLIEFLILRPSFMTAILNSPSFDDDMEILFSLHLPTKQEWLKRLEVIYHELIPETS